MEATLWQRLDEIITRTVRPMAERCDEESLFCGESVRALADAGFMGLPYPPEQGGRGSSYESYVRCVERLSKACPSVGVTYATHVGLACHPLHAFGSPMQKESFLRPMLRGDKLGAFALTEPEAGSDVGAIATTAELDGGRLGIAAQAVGIADAAFDEACVRLKERRQFGRTLEHFQGLRWKAADMWAKVEAARQLTLYAARLRDGGKRFRAEASAAKLVASEAAVWCASEAVQICGGSGYLQGSVAERLYRDAKITQIYEGTSEVQRMVIAFGFLG